MEARNSPGWIKGLLQRQFDLTKAARDPKMTHQLHWEIYLDLAQMWMTRNFTASGWATRTMPEAIHQEVLDFFHAGEKKTGGMNEGNKIHIAGDRTMHHLPGPLKQKVFQAIQPIVEDWAGEPRGSLAGMSTSPDPENR